MDRAAASTSSRLWAQRSGPRCRLTASTRAPAAHSCSASSRPIPPLAPVNTTTQSGKRMPHLTLACTWQVLEHFGVQAVYHLGRMDHRLLIATVVQAVHKAARSWPYSSSMYSHTAPRNHSRRDGRRAPQAIINGTV
ncbi:hypothetical protein WR25_06300 [Diploscapter pachys]|uniref:Uncharacterized protein n=1 Tax=Diploscapter pachys TaxID=2018661 RepID=A0A2A2K9E6_9BILA|nr:hypothetical protein WR25_06300 [Diploscapter pachys]